MSNLNYYLDWPIKFFKGDSIDFPTTILSNDISNWKIRAELFDEVGNCIQLATSNVTGGSVNQIEITDGANGKFTVKVLKASTECFEDRVFIEIETEDDDSKIRTLLRKELEFDKQEIDWDTK